MTTRDTGWRPTPTKERVGLGTILRRTGWVALSIGVLLAGFIVYELFVTSFFANRAQAALVEDLNERINTIAAETVTYRSADFELISAPLGMPDDVPLPGAEAITAALESSAGLAAAQALATTPPEAAPAGSIVSESAASPGDAIGRIEIPSIGLDWTVVEGVSTADLRKGAGHMPRTALPGQPGNAVISGHRTTYGAPFHNLGDTRKRDLITVTNATGSHVYQIVEKRVVLPNETWVTGQWQGSWLTLTTCHPKYSSRQRLVVFARLVGGTNAATLGAGA